MDTLETVLFKTKTVRVLVTLEFAVNHRLVKTEFVNYLYLPETCPRQIKLNAASFFLFNSRLTDNFVFV